MTGDRMTKIFQAQQTLRPGQIIQGKILKIYPENKAQILLGGQTLVAQLEASLSIEGKYHFQVQSSEEMIHLKVLGEELKAQSGTAVANLMIQLGIKTTKHNMAFVQKIVHENIPFDSVQLRKAMQILDRFKNKEQPAQTLTEMIARKLPITDNVFQALHANNNGSLSVQMSEMLEQLKARSINTELTLRLEQMIGTPHNEKTAFIKQIITTNHTGKQELFHVLKAMGLIDNRIDFITWKSEWKQLQPLLAQNTVSTPLSKDIKMPFQLNHHTVFQLMENFNVHRQALLTQSQEVMYTWGDRIRQAIASGSVLEQGEFTDFKKQLIQRIVPFLLHEQGQFMKLLSNNTSQLKQVMRMLDTLSNRQTYTQLDTALASNYSDKLFMSNTSPKEQFLKQVDHVLKHTGLSYENQIANRTLEENQTIKSMLIQLMKQGDGAIQEKAGQLLHFINGMQLNSVNESGSFIHASLQIPAEKIGLNKDLELEFESRKTADGKIDPDYCRIMFYLNLEYLKQTVIDMNIQKRSVSITIFNDLPNLKEKTRAVQPVLIQGLKALDYHLSSIHFKPLHEQIAASQHAHVKSYQSTSYQGVDYRV